MKNKKTKFEDLRSPVALPGYQDATRKMSGLRKKTKVTQYSEGPRTTERPLQPDEPVSDVKVRVFFETQIEQTVTRSGLREIELDDDLGNQTDLDGVTFSEVINQKSSSRDAIMISLLCKKFRLNWWDSKNPVERLWGQLNNGFLIIPEWQYLEDMKAVLCKRMDTMRPAGFAGVDLLVLRENKEAVKKQVYAKLISEGFMDGENCKIYTPEELDAIIATKDDE